MKYVSDRETLLTPEQAEYIAHVCSNPPEYSQATILKWRTRQALLSWAFRVNPVYYMKNMSPNESAYVAIVSSALENYGDTDEESVTTYYNRAELAIIKDLTQADEAYKDSKLRDYRGPSSNEVDEIMQAASVDAPPRPGDQLSMVVNVERGIDETLIADMGRLLVARDLLVDIAQYLDR